MTIPQIQKPAETHMHRIILGLFNPMPDKHASGCLANERGPCICGYADVAGKYLWALREAKKIAAENFGKQEVEGAGRLREPHELVEAAATAAPVLADAGQATCCKGLAPKHECRCEKEETATRADIFRSALLDIKAAHVPDQPASSQADEVSWVMQHIGMIRRIASKALEEASSLPLKECVPADAGLGLSREDLARAIQQFWQGPTGRPWDGSEDSCCEKLPAQADWFRRLADALLSQRPNPGGEREDTEICLFCGKPSGDDAMVDDNGEVACRSCGEAEFNAQDKEPAAPAQS
jgi:hypothetical protein